MFVFSAAGQACFARCGDAWQRGDRGDSVDPDNMSDCELNCFYSTLFGGVNGSTITRVALPRKVILQAWENAFAGGCPAIPPQDSNATSGHG